MGTDYASAAPEIWLHHAYIDAIWDRFQQKGDKYKFHNLTTSGNNFFLIEFTSPKLKGSDYIDNDNLSGCNMKIIYQDIFEEDRGKGIIFRRLFSRHTLIKRLHDLLLESQTWCGSVHFIC